MIKRLGPKISVTTPLYAKITRKKVSNNMKALKKQAI